MIRFGGVHQIRDYCLQDGDADDILEASLMHQAEFCFGCQSPDIEPPIYQ